MILTKKIIHWNRYHALLICMISGLVMFKPLDGLLSIGVGISFLYFLYIHVDLLKTYRPFAGYANWVTSVRLFAILLAGFFVKICTYPVFFVFLLMIILADALDGFLARRYGTSSTFGAYYDMETDAFFVYMIAYLLYQEGLAPFWVLWAGWLRYLAVLVEWALGIHGQPAPPNPFARSIAGFLFVALLLPWIWSNPISMSILMGAVIAVTFSFGYSFYLALFKS